VDKRTTTVLPFPKGYRAAGVLLHVTSLPSRYGIGDLGPNALTWIDRLEEAEQRWWQLLPLGPTGYGNSPYASLCSFAGNALLISPDALIEDGLLKQDDLDIPSFPPGFVDYDAVTTFKRRLIDKAWDNFKVGARPDLRPAYEQFCNDQRHWLEDFALFESLRAKFHDDRYLEWPIELVRRDSLALDSARRELAGEIERGSFAQFLVFRQGERLQSYARARGIQLIGDMPFFVSADSSDVWAHPELFLLDEQRRPRFVAGVPPDYFSAQGQLWGDPVYDWQVLRQAGYRWWIDRLAALLKHVDVVRLDHFRAFVAAWHVPTGAQTAELGKWLPGPGDDFFKALERELGGLPFIAEDLGVITSDVDALRDQFCLPGMRVLQFAFDGHSDNPHLPGNFVRNCVAYTGTHDNPTTRGWFEDLPEGQRDTLRKYLKQRAPVSSDAAHGLMELAWSSIAELAIAPLQDLLNLGREARMNVPGRPQGNWLWRCTEEMLSDPAFEWLRDLTKNANRSKALTTRSAQVVEAALRN
jgi:4-alpha-glucanotransferase